MRSSQVRDKVIRSNFPCWIETTDRECIDVSRYPRIGVDLHDDDEQPWVVLAFKSIYDDDAYSILGSFADEGDARVYYSEIVTKLQGTNHEQR